MTQLIKALQYTLRPDQKWTVGEKPKFTIDSKTAVPATTTAAPEPETLTVDSTAAAPAPTASPAAADNKTAAPAASAAVVVTTAADLEAHAQAIANADCAAFNAAGLRLNKKELTNKDHLEIAVLKTQAWVNAAKKYEEEKNFVEAIRCYRNAMFNPIGYLLKNSIFKNEIQRLEPEAVKKDKDKTNYFIVSAQHAYELDSHVFNPKGFAKALIELAHEEKIAAEAILRFLVEDVSKNIFNEEQDNLIYQHYFTVFVPVVNNDAHLLASLKKYGAQITMGFLASSSVGSAEQKFPVLVRTFFQADLLNNQKLRDEFKAAMSAAFISGAFSGVHKDLILAEIKKQFNTPVAAQIKVYLNPPKGWFTQEPFFTTRSTEKENLKLEAFNQINPALQSGDLLKVLALIGQHKEIAGVMDARTAVLLNGLELALICVPKAVPVAAADAKADAKTVTTDGKHATTVAAGISSPAAATATVTLTAAVAGVMGAAQPAAAAQPKSVPAPK